MRKKSLWIVMAVVLMMAFTTLGLASSTVMYSTETEIEFYDIPEYNESPLLSERVNAGELPPVADRLPVNPYVVDPIESIGRYGGTLRTATTSIESWGDHAAAFDFVAGLVKPNEGASDVIPNLASKVEFSEDMTTFRFYLREGLKWSDGAPVTTANVAFWYNDILLNEDLTQAIPIKFRSRGAAMEFTVIDDLTFEFGFADPQPFFLNSIIHDAAIVSPSHYLEQFHENYVDADEMAAMVAEAGLETWYQLFLQKNDVLIGIPRVPERPSLLAYKLTEKTSERLIFERNPYYWKVDSVGNQLPYIDRVTGSLASDREVITGMIMSGQIDFASRNVDIRNYPLYRQFEEEGNYRTFLWQTTMGSDTSYQFNMTHNDPVLREIFQDLRFRRALSLAIDRDEINDVVYSGHAIPRHATVLPSSQYYRPEFGDAYGYATYDPQRARLYLDEMGLATDAQGYRLRPDGERLAFTVEFTDRPYPVVPNLELVVEYWREIGVDAQLRAVSGELQSQRAPANMMDATIWAVGSTDMMFPISANFFVPSTPSWEESQWPEWGRWIASDGELGEEPPALLKDIRAWWEQILVEPDRDERVRLGSQILDEHAKNLWSIGTIGLSPRPLIANADLRNVPERNLWAWDTLTGVHVNLEQMFFDR